MASPLLERIRSTSRRSGTKVEAQPISIPNNTVTPVFTVSGGPVRVLAISGQVTTATANMDSLARITTTPTGGTEGDLSANTNIKNIPVGRFINLHGTPDVGLKVGGGRMTCVTDVVVYPGSIGFRADSGISGQIQWALWYIPQSVGAKVSLA